ncbi:MAG: hypothetical protein K8S56_09235 [Candidatus Cloacimonetes bacterium]|nr:hypothetical protein [Candidatus Cloacimonadota bacterium]
MKRFLLLVLILALVFTSILLLSCKSSGSGSGGISGPPVGTNVWWMFSLASGGYRDGYASISYLSDHPINNLQVSMNSYTCTASHYPESSYWDINTSAIDYESGDAVDIDLVINETENRSVFLTIPSVPEFTSDPNWDGTTDHSLTWTSDADPTSQYLSLWGPYDDDNPPSSCSPVYLNPADRSYALPAGAHGYTGVNGYLSAYLNCSNWLFESNTLFEAYEYASHYYNSPGSRSQPDHKDIHRKITQQIINEINSK